MRVPSKRIIGRYFVRSVFPSERNSAPESGVPNHTIFLSRIATGFATKLFSIASALNPEGRSHFFSARRLTLTPFLFAVCRAAASCSENAFSTGLFGISIRISCLAHAISCRNSRLPLQLSKKRIIRLLLAAHACKSAWPDRQLGFPRCDSIIRANIKFPERFLLSI